MKLSFRCQTALLQRYHLQSTYNYSTLTNFVAPEVYYFAAFNADCVRYYEPYAAIVYFKLGQITWRI